MLLIRVLTALVCLAIILPVLAYGGAGGVAILVAVCSSVAVWEVSRNLPAVRDFPSSVLTIALGLLIVLAFYAFSYQGVFAIVVWFPLAVLLVHLFLYNVIDNTLESVVSMIFVPAYVVIPLSHAVLLAKLFAGATWIVLVLVVVCLGDAGAYFAGRAFGKTRFVTQVSPKKTVEGLFGGLAGSVLGMAVVKLFAPWLPGWGLLFQLALVLVAADALGDLSASALKRRLEIKDYGSILPGHGGIMDRADSLIFGFPAAYHFIILTNSAIPS